MERESHGLAGARRLSRLLDALWERGVATRPSLEPDAIVAAAVRRERAEPASGAWRERLAHLCGALESEARLNPLGRTIAHGQLVRIVASRIRAERWLAKHPQIAERPVAAPVVLVGQMRSGTTRAHRLLACDRGFAHTRLFETLDPVPFGRGIDRRMLSAVAATALVRWCNPALDAIHPTSPRAPEEEFGLHAFSLWGAQFEGQWWVPGFVAQCEAAGGNEVREVYREFRRLLQIAGHVRGDDPARPWVLKAPQFCQDLDALMGVFPDARIIHLRRAPERVVGSGASLVWNQMRIQSDAADRRAIGAEWLRKTALRETRLLASLQRHPQFARIEIDYDEVSADWAGAVARIYRFLDLPLDPATLRRMEASAAGSRHHGHHYALEDFGLDPSRVAAAMA